MLSQLHTQEVINVNYDAVEPTAPLVLNFPTNEPYEMIAIHTTTTAAGAIALYGLVVRDLAGDLIHNISFVPWQFALTTVESTTGQTPDPSIVSLFGPNIAGFIASGLHVFNGWSIQWNDFLGTPGVTWNSNIFFTLARFSDESP